MRSKLSLRFGKGARGIMAKWNAVLCIWERSMIQLVQMALKDVFDGSHETSNGLVWHGSS